MTFFLSPTRRQIRHYRFLFFHGDSERKQEIDKTCSFIYIAVTIKCLEVILFQILSPPWHQLASIANSFLFTPTSFLLTYQHVNSLWLDNQSICYRNLFFCHYPSPLSLSLSSPFFLLLMTSFVFMSNQVYFSVPYCFIFILYVSFFLIQVGCKGSLT